LLNQGDPRAKLQSLMTLRYPVYETADITIDAGEESPDATTSRVVDALRDWLDANDSPPPEPVENTP
jgi:shikimate kinase